MTEVGSERSERSEGSELTAQYRVTGVGSEGVRGVNHPLRTGWQGRE